MQDAIRRTLALTRSSTARERTADITTIGRRTVRPRRIEIWFYRVGKVNYLGGLPQPGPQSRPHRPADPS